MSFEEVSFKKTIRSQIFQFKKICISWPMLMLVDLACLSEWFATELMIVPCFVEALKLLDDRYFTNGKTLLPLRSIEEDMELVYSLNNFLTTRCNHLPRPIIPIGPRFQTKISEWESATDIKLCNDDDSLKWLGTQIWPIPFISETNIWNLV